MRRRTDRINCASLTGLSLVPVNQRYKEIAARIYKQLDTEQVILRLDVGEKIASALLVCEGSGLTALQYQKL